MVKTEKIWGFLDENPIATLIAFYGVGAVIGCVIYLAFLPEKMLVYVQSDTESIAPYFVLMGGAFGYVVIGVYLAGLFHYGAMRFWQWKKKKNRQEN